MSRITRLATAAALAFTAAALPLAVAVPAQATIDECVDYLQGHGYLVTYNEREACYYGWRGDQGVCIDNLMSHDVFEYHAREACLLAARE